MSKETAHQPKLSRRFRRGMAGAVFTAGAVAGAAAHSTVSSASNYDKLPGCEFVASSHGVNSPHAATDKLSAAGADVTDASMSVYAAEDGHQRVRGKDPVDRRGDLVVQSGDLIDVSNVEHDVCLAAGGVVVSDSVDPAMEQEREHNMNIATKAKAGHQPAHGQPASPERVGDS